MNPLLLDGPDASDWSTLTIISIRRRRHRLMRHGDGPAVLVTFNTIGVEIENPDGMVSWMATESETLRPRSDTSVRYRWNSVAFLASMLALALVALGVTLVSSRASSSPLLDESTISASREIATLKQPQDVVLAEVNGIQLKLPMFEEEVTAVGYHPVSGDDVFDLEPMGQRLNSNALEKGLGQIFSGDDSPGYFIMEEGKEFDSATGSMDIGAPAGTVVYAPVDGTIASIKSYELRGVCPDTEIRIQTQSQANLVVVLSHIDNSEAALGQPVRAGVSRLGSVRKMDACYQQQLGEYTYDDGNHLHMQVERNLYRSGS